MEEVQEGFPFSRTGPYVQVAAFCEQVLQEKNGVISLIRIIDTLNHQEVGPNPPAVMPPITWNMKLVLMLKPGVARGRYDVKITPRFPSGEEKPPILTTVHLEGGVRGANIISNFTFTFQLEGLHWFEIQLSGTILTRIPFEVKYMRIQHGQ